MVKNFDVIGQEWSDSGDEADLQISLKNRITMIKLFVASITFKTRLVIECLLWLVEGRHKYSLERFGWFFKKNLFLRQKIADEEELFRDLGINSSDSEPTNLVGSGVPHALFSFLARPVVLLSHSPRYCPFRKPGTYSNCVLFEVYVVINLIHGDDRNHTQKLFCVPAGIRTDF